MRRRALLANGFALTPLASLLLSACQADGELPNGMQAFKWDRDVCTRCKMVISDRRFASQIRGGPSNTAFKFDDIGCAATWISEKLKEHTWLTDPATRIWVADFANPEKAWLQAATAHYVSGPSSPMGYNYAAYAEPQRGSIGFEAMGQKTSATWPANCLPGSTKTASAAPN